MTNALWDEGPSGSNALWDESLKPKEKAEEPSYASRVFHEGLPAVANTALDIASAIPSGVVGAAKALGSGRMPGGGAEAMERGMEGFEGSMKTLQDILPHFRSPQAQEAQQTLGEGLGAIQEAGGSALNWLGRKQMDLMGVTLDPRTEMLREAATRTLGEAGTQLAPIPGLPKAAGALSRVPYVGSVARGAARGTKEYRSWGFPEERPLPPEPYGTGLDEPPHPAWAPAIPNEFRNVEELTTGGRGLRENTSEITSPLTPDKQGALDLETTQQNQLRQITDQDRGQARTSPTDIPYRQYDPNDVNQLVGAEDTPGFLRKAEDLIALRFDRIRNLETSSNHAIEKLKLEEKSAQSDADAATAAIDSVPVPKEVQANAELKIARDPQARFTEYLPADQVWLLRDHNRLTDPKSDSQFASKEASVLKNSINEPLEIKYSTADGKAVLTNGNTRASLAMKHGLPEIPVRVTVVDRPLAGTEAVNGVDVGKFDLPKGNAKPSDIGLKGRPLRNLGPISRQRGAIEVIPPKPKEEGPRNPKDILDVVRKLGTKEDRLMQQVIDDAGLSRDTLTDFSSAEQGLVGMTKAGGKQVFDLRTNRALVEDTPLEPVMTALEKRVSRVDLDGNLRLDSDLHGSGYGIRKINKLLGRPFEERIGSEDGVLTAVDKMTKLGTKESSDFINTWNKYNGETDDIPFQNPKAREAYETIKAKLLGRLASINPKRIALGKDPIDPIPGYLPLVREAGDYILTTLDKDGKKSLYTFSSMYKARRAAEGLKKDFPELTVSEAQHKRLDKLEDTHLSALYDTARALQEGDPLAMAVNKAINQYFTQRGAGGHFRQRSRGDRIGGYLGETGDIGELRKGLVSYFEYLNNYESNLDRALIQHEIDTAKVSGPPQPGKSIWKQNKKTGGWYQEDQTNSSLLRDAVPNFHKYATDVLMKSRGALQGLDQFDKAVVEELGKGLQFGETAVQRAIYKLNNVATVGFLSKTSFWLSQFFQHPQMTPARMMHVLAEVRPDAGLLGETAKLPMDAARMSASLLKSYAYTLFPWLDKIVPGLDSDRSGVINYATKEGYVNPALSHMLEAPGAYDPYSKKFYQGTGYLEREVVRIPSLIALEDYLRPYIKDTQQRYEVASGQMFRAMAGTTRSNSPLLYNNLGPFGSMMRTLKSYSTNWHGQGAEYVADAAKTGDMSHLRTLGTFMGTNALFAGIGGVLLVPEATAIITLWNAVTNSNVRTPQEWFATNGNTQAARDAGGANIGPDLTAFFNKYEDMKNVVVHGLASSLFGKDMTAQVQPPDLTQMLSIVPAKVPIDMIGPLFNYMVAAAQGQVTDSIRMKMWQGLSLNNPHIRAFIEQRFQQPGQPVPRAHMNMSGNFYRDQEGFATDQSYLQAMSTGMLTLREKQADMFYHFFKQNEARLEKDRANTLNSMTDDLLRDGKIDPDKLKSYVEKFGDPRNLAKDIKDTLVRRHTTGLQFEQIKGSHGGLGFAGKMQHMQPYLQNNPLWGPSANPQPIPGPQSEAGNIQLASTTPTNSTAEQRYGDSVPLDDRQAVDPRYHGDTIDPHEWVNKYDRQGMPLNPMFDEQKWTKDKIPNARKTIKKHIQT